MAIKLNRKIMEEQWIRWEPILDLSKKYKLNYVVDNIDFFVLFLAAPDKKNIMTKILGTKKL